MSQEVDQLYSIADISRHFSLPESTCRYYCKRFARFIEAVGEGRRRRYRSSTIEVIGVILEEMKKSRTATAVEETLALRFPSHDLAVHEARSVVSQPQAEHAHEGLGGAFEGYGLLPPVALSLLERQTIALEGIAKMLHIVTDNLCTKVNTNAATHATDMGIAALQKDVARLATMLNESEKTQQADIEQLRTWLRRIIRHRASQSASTTS